jgi:hypothetical protein
VNTPSATDFINVACGADNAGDPIVYSQETCLGILYTLVQL